ncbi:oligosaccharide flippase family protein [Acuticoccus sp. MNP-M23]|uniref:oligosaccharide flippase family protein n=1 Tax=Acuticoccus sp. MNP-M23 TaxID=3072793 RepID=UPI0028157A11|nr:oligosaccharide flippase family protein [Acuticoccus sp. MNP-M23]WMS42349.1 oligosaccharide flippase family protein [Acuticoccus sp. MNP-M23]
MYDSEKSPGGDAPAPPTADAGGPMRRVAGWVGALLAGAMARIVILLGATIVLARFLTPAEFGLASLITSIVVLLTVFAGGDAFEEALAQRKVLRKIHLEAVIGASWLFTTAIIAVAAILAVVAGPLFDEPAFWPLFAFGCVSIYANSITTTATALVRRRKRFQVIARGELIGAALGAAGAIGLAALGAGPWAVVALRVIMVSAVAVNLALASGVLLLPRLRLAPIRELAHFSSFSLGQRLATDGSYMVLNYAVATFFSVAAVGYFSMALRLTDPMRGVARSVSHNIAFSFFRARVEQADFARVFLNTLAVVSMLAFPAFLGIAAVAGLFIEVVVGTGWDESVPIVRVLAIGSALIIPLDLVATALNARGSPAHLFTQRLMGLGAMLVTLAATVAAGLSGLGAGLARAVGDVAEASYAMRALSRSLGVRPLAPLRAMAPQLLAAVVMAVAVNVLVAAMLGSAPKIVVLGVGVGVGAIIYGALVAALSSRARGWARQALAGRLRK